MPVYFQRVRADRPRQRNRGGRSERAREQFQHAVFDQQRGEDQFPFQIAAVGGRNPVLINPGLC